MKYLNKKLTLGIAGIGAIFWGVFKAYQHLNSPSDAARDSSKQAIMSDQSSDASDEEHLPYEYLFWKSAL